MIRKESLGPIGAKKYRRGGGDMVREEELEALNAQLDVWIDQEEFNKIKERIKPSRPDNAKLKKAFRKKYCTIDSDDDWHKLFIRGIPAGLKIIPLGKNTRKASSHILIKKQWASLFWAKLIRAKIQEKGSDCYFQRLDHLILYLETQYS